MKNLTPPTQSLPSHGGDVLSIGIRCVHHSQSVPSCSGLHPRNSFFRGEEGHEVCPGRSCLFHVER